MKDRPLKIIGLIVIIPVYFISILSYLFIISSFNIHMFSIPAFWIMPFIIFGLTKLLLALYKCVKDKKKMKMTAKDKFLDLVVIIIIIFLILFMMSLDFSIY